MPPETKTPDNSEINKALKEFEEKANTEATSYKAVKFYNETGTPKMVRLVMKLSGGAIKEQKQAEYILFGLVILMVITTGIIFYRMNGGGVSKLTPEQEKANADLIIQMEKR